MNHSIDTASDGTPHLPQRKHLRRLDIIFEQHRAPLYYITGCVQNRQPVLATHATAAILADAWKNSLAIYGWLIGFYMIMPDHIHFFTSPGKGDAKSLSRFQGDWKRWTQGCLREIGIPSFTWQKEFFDHLLRSKESYEEKWNYVRMNPVKEKLVARPEDWPFQGEIHKL
jgi:REP element-mobilizing transposase RayT